MAQALNQADPIPHLNRKDGGSIDGLSNRQFTHPGFCHIQVDSLYKGVIVIFLFLANTVVYCMFSPIFATLESKLDLNFLRWKMDETCCDSP